jgi:biopolymer transport protein ExbD
VPELAAHLSVPSALEPPWRGPDDDAAAAREAGDPIRLGRRRPHEEAAMEMAPMIDVTFLLLIFFMLTNSMANPAPMDVPEAVHGQGVPMEDQLLILVDQRGRYHLGETANEQSAAGSVDALVGQVDQQVQDSRETLDVIISAHRHSKHRCVRELLEGLASVDGLGEIRLGVKEKLD